MSDEVEDLVRENRSHWVARCVPALRKAGFTVERCLKLDGSGPNGEVSFRSPRGGPIMGWIYPSTNRVTFRLPREKCPVVDYRQAHWLCPVLIFPGYAEWEYQVYMIVTHLQHVSVVVEQAQRALEHYEQQRLSSEISL